MRIFLLLLLQVSLVAAPAAAHSSEPLPVVVSTWPFVEAVRAAWRVVTAGFSAVDAVVEGCTTCEELRCDGTVGPGGSPDENGETTLDALVMNGSTMEVGAVAAMRFVKDGIKAAKLVMEHTEHTLIVGEMASIFAISMGLLGPSNLSSPESLEKWIRWKRNSCQPNFRKNVIPTNSCGPYSLSDAASTSAENSLASPAEGNLGKDWPEDMMFVASKANSIPVSNHYHDTISMAVIDKAGRIAVGTSTNGATFKIPGRVGDGPIAGSSAYADDEVGACGATGDESMRQGMEPKIAAADAISRIARKYPDFVGAIFALNKNGVHAGACHGWTFQYSVRTPTMEDVEVFTVVVAAGAARRSEFFPIVVSTWPFVEAVRTAWSVADAGFSAVDAAVDGCSTCEKLRCVGPGGSPDEDGETTLDALVMNGFLGIKKRKLLG
ncbi:hypothetical protein IEQ34_022805 [Dendrobium chrysotoxum]|uniref:beta-aspartyl-peptidase n=1 Tax=Dendrobium chrysotoxum TaxID=161865 RepID=A0AAV7FYI2_DENCH|nr:hypothetical protein IEQ34_022805 [Dendrobium chrysotoxum]